MAIAEIHLVDISYPPSAPIAHLKMVYDPDRRGKTGHGLLSPGDIPELTVIAGADRPGKLASRQRRQRCERD